MPLGTVLVAETDWSTSTKSLVNGGLIFGFEVMALIAAAVMGKEIFDRIMAPVKQLLSRRLVHVVHIEWLSTSLGWVSVCPSKWISDSGPWPVARGAWHGP